ncbi:MAG: glycoside hydrolase domain-containing protein, partial [Bdellovibrionota bacterium]
MLDQLRLALASLALLGLGCTSTPSTLTAVWVNDGGEKIRQDDLRCTTSESVALWGARNETLSAAVILEAADGEVPEVAVSLPSLTGPSGYILNSGSGSTSDVFNWTGRQIELFHVGYLPIKGLSRLSYENYDERHVPTAMRRSFDQNGIGTGKWSDRPGADKYFPEIAVPIELKPTFTVAEGKSQIVWVDVYIPKDAPAGTYTGEIKITEAGELTRSLPVSLVVHGFALPDTTTARTMVASSYANVAKRYTGVSYPNAGTPEATLNKKVRDRQFLLAHRHRISLIDNNDGADSWTKDAPRPEWEARLNGSLFSAANAYQGPGESVGTGVFAVGIYGSWTWKSEGQAGMWTHCDAWESWFQTYAPTAERFLYLIDESTDTAQIEQWSDWMKSNPGVGRSLSSFATIAMPEAASKIPSLSIAASWMALGVTADWASAKATFSSANGKKGFMYNGKRPASGSFAIEDDGVALRQLPWGQYKLGIDRWFFWESTYYNDYQSGRGENHLFTEGLTFGTDEKADESIGRTGWNYSNGDGVLLYPGTDTVFPAESLGLEGPIASLRLKHWRRGIQDVEYLALARARDSTAVDAIIARMVPKALWEYGVTDPKDPTWVRTDVSWSANPED